MSPQREKITFDPNVTVEVTLEFDGGKEVSGRNGPQYLYWCDGGRSMFLDPEVHNAIQATGAKAGDTLEITPRKHGKSTSWEVVHVVDEPSDTNSNPEFDPRTRTTAPVVSQPRKASTPTRSDPQPGRPATASQPAPQAPITPATCNMLSALLSAIHALAEARTEAERYGIKMIIDAEMVRRTATTIYIGRSEACNQ